MALQTKILLATGSTGHHNFTLTLREESVDKANNTSTVSWDFRMTPKHNNYDFYGWGNTVKFSVVINGNTYSGSIPSYDGVSEEILATSDDYGNLVIKHNSGGDKTISASFSVNSSGNTTYYLPGTASKSDTFTLTYIPRFATITDAPSSWNDEQNPTIYYSNPSGSNIGGLQAWISWTGFGDIVRSLDVNDTEITFTLTNAERKQIRQAFAYDSTPVTVNFVIWSKLGNEENKDSISSNFDIINATPTLNPTVIDAGSTSTALTGNANTMIKGFNHMKVVANATAYKEAVIQDRKIINGGTTLFSETGEFIHTTDNKFIFKINDSRNKPVEKTITIPMIEYIPLTCSVEGDIALSSTDGTKAKITFTVSGNYFNGSFGAVSNTLKLSYSLEYEGGGISLNPLTIPAAAIKSDGTYSLTYEIPNELDYKKSYVVKIYAEDKILTDIISESKTLKAVPVFDWGENDFNFNVPVYIDGLNLSGAAKALTNIYDLTVTTDASDTIYYVNSASASLMGNNLRCYFSVERDDSLSSYGQINEPIATITVEHGGKIKEFRNTSFVCGKEGEMCSFYTDNYTKISDTKFSYKIYLAASAIDGAPIRFSGYYVNPVTLNLDNF